MTVYARVGNLSEGGLFLRTSTPLRQGERAILRLRDGNATEVAAPATVVWTSNGADGPAGMGLEFESLDEKALETIRQIISNELLGPPPAG